MVRHPSVHPISVYSEVRSHMETVHKTPFREWVLAQENSFPMGFAEFPTLSGYAYKMRPEKYSFINIGNGCEPPNKMLQGWSKKGIHQQIKWKDGNIMSHVERWNDIVGSVEPPVEDVEEVIA
jgi:hypothetical protein